MDRNAEPQARVFGSLAADYAAARPGYPAPVFVEIAGVSDAAKRQSRVAFTLEYTLEEGGS